MKRCYDLNIGCNICTRPLGSAKKFLQLLTISGSLHVEKSIEMMGIKSNPVAREISATILGLPQKRMGLESIYLKVPLVADLEEFEQVLQ